MVTFDPIVGKSIILSRLFHIRVTERDVCCLALLLSPIIVVLQQKYILSSEYLYLTTFFI